MPFTPRLVINEPVPGDKAVIKGFSWTLTGIESSIILDKFETRCSPLAGALPYRGVGFNMHQTVRTQLKTAFPWAPTLWIRYDGNPVKTVAQQRQDIYTYQQLGIKVHLTQDTSFYSHTADPSGTGAVAAANAVALCAPASGIQAPPDTISTCNEPDSTGGALGFGTADPQTLAVQAWAVRRALNAAVVTTLFIGGELNHWNSQINNGALYGTGTAKAKFFNPHKAKCIQIAGSLSHVYQGWGNHGYIYGGVSAPELFDIADLRTSLDGVPVMITEIEFGYDNPGPVGDGSDPSTNAALMKRFIDHVYPCPVCIYEGSPETFTGHLTVDCGIGAEGSYVPTALGNAMGGAIGTPGPSQIRIALTKTGNFVPATPFHNVTLSPDSTVHDLAPIDFSGEVTITNEEAVSGNVGILLDWTTGFSGEKVEIGDCTIQVCESDAGGDAVAYGLGYGEFDSNDEYVGVVSGKLYATDGDYLPLASSNHWSENLAYPFVLTAGKWQFAQFGKEEFLTEPSQGVFRRDVSITAAEHIKPLYQDYLNPGRDGDASSMVSVPPYLSHPFDSAVDTISIIASSLNGGTIVLTSIDATSNKPTIGVKQGSIKFGYIEFELDLTTPLDMNTLPNVWPYLMLHFINSHTLNGDGLPPSDNSTLGYTNDLVNFTVRFADAVGWSAGHQTPIVTGTAVSKMTAAHQRDCWAFFDLNTLVQPAGSYTSVMAAVSKIRIRFGMRGPGQLPQEYYRLEEFQQLGTYYHRYLPGLKLETALPETDSEVEYAFNYTQAGIVAPATNATKLTVPPTLALGVRDNPLDAKVPYGGSTISLAIPTAPAPFGTAALINIYRNVAAPGSGNVKTWRRVYQSADNTVPFSQVDYLSDEWIDTHTATYPITTLVFDEIGPEGSGQAQGIINMCSWAGVMVYFHENGKAYFSESGHADVVLWEKIVVDLPSDSLNVPRSLQVADNQGQPVLVGVPMARNLYMFTRKDGFVMVIPPGGTPATASFPSSISGVRGVVGVRAACRYLQGALFGSDDSLWYVEKWDTRTDIPDTLKEVTGVNRGMWQTLIGDAETRINLVVRQVGGDIWCFCEERFIHINKDGFTVYGEWVGGGTVEDAYADPFRGMVLQFNDGSLSVTGKFYTDRGTNLAGDNGTAPSWTRRGKKFTRPFDLKKARVVYENASGGLATPAIRISAYSQRSRTQTLTPGNPPTILPDSITFTDPVKLHGTKPFNEGAAFPGKPGGQFWEIELAGSNYDVVTSALVVGTPGSTEPTK